MPRRGVRAYTVLLLAAVAVAAAASPSVKGVSYFERVVARDASSRARFTTVLHPFDEEVAAHPQRDAHGVPLHRASAVVLLPNVFGHDLTLELTRADDLVASDFAVVDWREGPDGRPQLDVRRGFENCHYSGHVRDHPGSVAVLSTCGGGLDGYVEVDGQRLHISPVHKHRALVVAGGLLDNEHVVFRDEDVQDRTTKRCGAADPKTGKMIPHSHQPQEAGAEVEEEVVAGKQEFKHKEEQGTSPNDAPSTNTIHVELRRKEEERFHTLACATPSSDMQLYQAPSGCSCKSEWTFNSITTCGSKCNNPDNDANGPWCFVTDSSCAGGSTYAYCTKPASTSSCTDTSVYSGYVPKTSGCTCKDEWAYNGKKICGGSCANPDSDSNGPWCFTTSACNGVNYNYCHKPSSTPTCDFSSSNNPFSQYSPPSGCTCKDSWTYNSKTHCGGICGNPDSDSNGPWCFTTGSCSGSASSGTSTYVYCGSSSSSSGGGSSSSGGSTSGGSTSVDHNGRTVELLLVLDKAVVDDQGSNTETFAISIANSVRTNYRKLSMNIEVVLTSIVTFSSGDPSALASSSDMNALLNAFTSWRQSYTNNDNAQLITGRDLSGSTTGLAWVGTMCQGYSVGVDEYDTTSANMAFTADTVSHEMGHNFGCSHDSSGNSCSSSGYIMAAVGSTSGAGNLQWSSCSRSYITNQLQSLEGGSSCLANAPSTVRNANSNECGDGIVSGTEQCDLGVNNGKSGYPCTSSCQQVSGTQCASGACCSTSGRYLPSGTVCRQATSDCDIVDYCSGSSASCGTNWVKRDGSQCSSAGPGSKCYQGKCVGYDAQCKKAWSAYTGTWVHAPSSSSGKSGSCASGCGTLKCTNTAWTDYCYLYECPNGYTCSVAGSSLSGGQSKWVCSCTETQTTTNARVEDGTPCSTAADKICISGQCVDRPASQTSGCQLDADCGGRGTCSQDGTCACDDGFSGAYCENKFSCDVNCAEINREGCRAEDLCGMRCLDGFETSSETWQESTGCDLKLVAAPTITSDSTASGSSPSNLVDRLFTTVWKAHFTNGTQSTLAKSGFPTVTLVAAAPIRLHRYDLRSAPAGSDPAGDPASWVLEGSLDGQRFVQMDAQNDFRFEARSEKRSFLVKSPASFSHFRFTFTALRDAAPASNASFLAKNITDNGDNTITVEPPVVGFSDSSSELTSLHIAQIGLYEQIAIPEYRKTGSSTNVALIAGLSVMGVVIVIGLALAVVMYCRARPRTAKGGQSFDRVTSAVAMADADDGTTDARMAKRVSMIPSRALPSVQMKKYSVSVSQHQQPQHQPQRQSQWEGYLPPAATAAAKAPSPIEEAMTEEEVAYPRTAPHAGEGRLVHADDGDNWSEYATDDGIPYFVNRSTGESVWQKK